MSDALCLNRMRTTPGASVVHALPYVPEECWKLYTAHVCRRLSYGGLGLGSRHLLAGCGIAPLSHLRAVRDSPEEDAFVAQSPIRPTNRAAVFGPALLRVVIG